MKKLLTILALLVAVVVPGRAQTEIPADSVADTPAAPALDSQFDFGAYKVSAPAGLMSTPPANGTYQAMLPGTTFRLVAMVVDGKARKLRDLAANGAKSLRLDPDKLKEVRAAGFDGHMVTDRRGDLLVTYAVLRDGNKLVTLVVTEPETLQPLGPRVVQSLARN